MKDKDTSGPGSSIAIIVILLLMVIGFVYLLKDRNVIPPAGQIATSTAPTTGAAPSTSPATTTFPSYYQDPSTWQATTDTNGGFSISYPLDFPVTDNPIAATGTDWRLGANGTIGAQDFTLTVPKAFEPQTNFNDATLTVGRSADATAIADCLVATNGESEADGAVFINGIQFNVFTSNDAGAGNIYDTTSYRTVHNGQCYAVEYTIHSGELANYPASYDLTQFDMDKVQSTLDLVVSTFKFL